MAVAAAGASAGSAAAEPSSPHTSAAPCGRLACRPGAAASDTPAAVPIESVTRVQKTPKQTPSPALFPEKRSSHSGGYRHQN